MDGKRQLIGSHVASADPINEARARNADIVQFFLGSPQRWSAPSVSYPGGAARLLEDTRAAEVGVYIHAAYLINVATSNNKVRIPSRSLLQATCTLAGQIGARGVVVHGGSVQEGDDLSVGYDNWFKAIDALHTDVPLLIENTAGGQRSVARHVDSIARLWERISTAAGFAQVGFCFDTAHAFASGEEFDTVVSRLMAITGRIDLVHCNDSQTAAGSGADRHANLGTGLIPPDELLAVIRETDAPIIVETPNGEPAQAADIAWLRQRL
ncbi:MAG: deoxyribonuclease IV [Propionibacteriaceae bacterium]|jgi:deoxyribonuclease-4|nr:deoxyribonuclease IV [Propionibacteriaceae bacterium]